MRPRGWRDGLALAAWLLGAAFPLIAQTEGSLGVGASVVRYDGFLTSSAFVFAPAVRFDSPRLSLAGLGSWTVFETGHGVIQGSAAGSWLAGSSGSWRLELSGSAGASQYAGRSSAAHVLGGARLHVFGAGITRGGWIGVNTGASGETSGAPVEVTMAGWAMRKRLALLGSATRTWLGRVGYVDLVGAMRWSGPHLELQVSVGARPWARDPVDERDVVAIAYGEISAAVPVNRWMALSLAGGRYPSDPVRHSLGAAYLSAGLRVRTARAAPPSVPLQTTGVLRGRPLPTEKDAPPLEVTGAEERRILRVRARDLASVEVMGDFTDWLPVKLARVAPDRWEIALVIPAGVHRVTIRHDGGPWSAPGGTRLERTEFGEEVGILVVP